MTTGVSKDGHALFPIMPYPYYASMDPQDANDIIAYIRTLKPLDISSFFYFGLSNELYH
jgi:hypothetical protein